MATEQYPLPVFHFQVEGVGARVGFSEVSGLNTETQIIEYRDGASKDYSMLKQPGIRKYPNVTLKRGIIKGDSDFLKWLNTISLNKVDRKNLTISLLNENHEPVVVWSIENAWPTKVDGPGLKATGNEVAIESIELAHEGLKVEFK